MFRIWFEKQPLDQKRAVVRERMIAYFTDPIADEILKACPPDVREAANQLRKVAMSADWSAHN